MIGYMMNADVLRAIMKIFRSLKEKLPSLKYVCDPVMADDGKLYPSLSPDMVLYC